MIIYWDKEDWIGGIWLFTEISPSFPSHKYWGTNLEETAEQFSLLASYISSQLEILLFPISLKGQCLKIPKILQQGNLFIGSYIILLIILFCQKYSNFIMEPTEKHPLFFFRFEIFL